MFCSKCGVQVDDGNVSCHNCGAPVKAPSFNPVPSKPKKSFNFKDPKFLGIVGAVVAVLLAFWLFGGFGDSQSYESAVSNYVEGVFDADSKQILNTFPSRVVDMMCDDEGVSKNELIAELNYELEDFLEEIEYEFGRNWSVKHKIISTEKYDSDDLEWIKDKYDEIGVKVKDAKMVYIEVTVKGGGESLSEEMEIGVIKVGDSWYVDVQNTDEPF